MLPVFNWGLEIGIGNIGNIGNILFCPCGKRLHEPRGKRRFGLACKADLYAGCFGRDCPMLPIFTHQLTTHNLQLSTFNYKHLPTLHLPRVGAAADCRRFWPAARAGCREAGDHRGGQGDGAFSQAGGEGALHEGGKRRLLHEVGGRAQELSRQTGRRGRNHARRTKGTWALTPPCWLILTWAGHAVSAKMV